MEDSQLKLPGTLSHCLSQTYLVKKQETLVYRVHQFLG